MARKAYPFTRQEQADFDRRYRAIDWREFGAEYLAEGRRRADKQATGYKVDLTLEPDPDGPESEYKKVCRTARNMLKRATVNPQDPVFLDWVESCRLKMNEQTAEASRHAAAFLARERAAAEVEQPGPPDNEERPGRLCQKCGVNPVVGSYRYCRDCATNGGRKG